MNIIQRFLNSVNQSASNKTMGIFYTLGGIAAPNDRFSSTVFACVDAIIARCEMAFPKLLHYSNDGEAKRDFNHPILTVLNRPNSRQTWRDLIKWTVGYRETKGNAYWWLRPSISGKKIVGIIVLDPEKMKFNEDDKGEITGYVYTSNKGARVPFEADEIVSFPYFNPRSQLSGIGPLQAARLAQENDLLAQTWNNKLFKNGAMPSGVLQTDQKITQEIFDRVKIAWQQQYSGESNMAKTAILEAGLKYEKLSLSQADMSYYEGRKDSREEIMMTFRTPKAALGMADGVNRASAEATLYSFAILKIQPIMEDIFARVNEFVLPKFGLNPRVDKLEFDSLVPEDNELKLKEHVELTKNKIMTINEVRSRRGLTDVAWGDIPYVEITKPSADNSQNKEDTSDNKDSSRSIEKKAFNHNNYRQAVDKVSKSLEAEFVPELKKTNTEVQKIIVDYIKETGKQRGLFGDLNPITESIFNSFLKTITVVLTTSYHRSGKITIDYLDINENDISLENQTAVDWITKNALNDATSIVSTLKGEITPIITSAITEGLSTFDLTQKLTTYFSGMTDWKARQIAHTEIHKGISAAAHLTAEATGRELYKMWSTSGDDRVCEACAVNEAEGYIPMNETFSSGAMHPEDSHPNCRCREYYEPADKHKQ